MTLRPLVMVPNQALRDKSQPVKEINDDIQQLIKDMFETMHHASGIGLAAIQVNIPLRLFVTEIEDEPLVFINPVITSTDADLSSYNEGCLSIPTQKAIIHRPKACEIEYIDAQGNGQKRQAEGLLATCIQHEFDHLNGVLFVDHLSKMKRDMIISRSIKNQKQMKSSLENSE